MNRQFDLNIERVLEHWEIEHALREIIANAIDEQMLTETPDIEVFSDQHGWHIRDFGRGLNYKHFTQNENQEKLINHNIIGKFGVGLKDALAVLYRHNIEVEIISKHSLIKLDMKPKDGFNITTLHAIFSDSKRQKYARNRVHN